MLFNIKAFATLAVVLAVGAGLWYVKNLNVKLENATKLNEALSVANTDIARAWSDDRNKTNQEIEALLKAKNKVRVEKEYVEKIKYKIIKDSNASCVSAINDIYTRLREQNADTNSTSPAKKP